jgi:hypothetical protein
VDWRGVTGVPAHGSYAVVTRAFGHGPTFGIGLIRRRAALEHKPELIALAPRSVLLCERKIGWSAPMSLLDVGRQPTSRIGRGRSRRTEGERVRLRSSMP